MSTKIILNQDVTSLGEEGDIKMVADGYARNYLLPKKLAVLHTPQNIKQFEQRREAIETRKEEKRKAALSTREKLEAESIQIQMPAGETGKLFGSVTSAMIMEELEKRGITGIDRKKIELKQHSIKTIGKYTVTIKLYGEETAKLEIDVVSQDGKAEANQAEEAKQAEKAEEAIESTETSEEEVPEDIEKESADEDAGEEAEDPKAEE